MRAILNRDKILAIVFEGGVEIGDLPPKIGLERLRVIWNDVEKKYYVVDLEYHSPIYVKQVGENSFDLFAVQVEDSYLVPDLKWSDRKKLCKDSNNVFRIMTPEEISDKELEESLLILRRRLKLRFKEEIGTIDEQLFNIIALVLSLIVYSRQQPQILKDFYDKIIPEIKDAFPIEKVDDILTKACKSIKEIMEQYWESKEKLLLEINATDYVTTVDGGAISNG